MHASSVNTRHTQEKGTSVFVARPAAVEVICSSARRRMDHSAKCEAYSLFSHTLTLDPELMSAWPERTDVACWHCCHPFDTTPVSIPSVKSQLVHNTYEVYGVFCSMNCAKKFVLEKPTYDQQQVLLQLNEVCCSVFGIPGADIFTAKEAPPRFFLKMFGGHLDIGEFRATSLTARTVLVTPPFVSYAMVLETHAVKGAEEEKSVDVEPLREGQHMMRGLRRPTHPATPLPILEDSAKPRFGEFVKAMELTADVVRPTRIPAKKSRKKDAGVAGGVAAGNTLNLFLKGNDAAMETE